VRTVALAFGETVAVLFPIVDPIGNVPTFLALTARWDAERRRKLISQVVVLVFVGLAGFAVVGEPVLHFFGISLEALQIAGGLIIAFTGFRMITAAEAFVEESAHAGSIAFAPLTVPLLAGPGAMAAILALDSREQDVLLSLPGTIAGIAVICLCIYVLFRAGDRVARFLGPAGLTALTVIMGLVVLAIGVEMVVHGILTHGAVVKALHGHHHPA
jgi:multiple antibiotic resistance protein